MNPAAWIVGTLQSPVIQVATIALRWPGSFTGHLVHPVWVDYPTTHRPCVKPSTGFSFTNHGCMVSTCGGLTSIRVSSASLSFPFFPSGMRPRWLDGALFFQFSAPPFKTPDVLTIHLISEMTTTCLVQRGLQLVPLAGYSVRPRFVLAR